MALTRKLQAEIRALRKRGISVREISRRTQIPSATVHRHVRDVQVDGRHPGPKQHTRTHGYTKKEGRYIEITRGRRYHGLLVHLPDSVFCPECGEESDDIVLCLDCGRVWMGLCEHGAEIGDDQHRGVNLAELRRGDGDGELHVLPLTFQG